MKSGVFFFFFFCLVSFNAHFKTAYLPLLLCLFFLICYVNYLQQIFASDFVGWDFGNAKFGNLEQSQSFVQQFSYTLQLITEIWSFRVN